MTATGIGIVGCGGAAIDIGAAIEALPGVRLVAVHDRDAHAATDLAQRSGAAIHPTLHRLLDDTRVEVVYVALPHDLLAAVAEQALRAGRHVLVEKPMALDVGAIDLLDRLARRLGRRLGVVFELRESAAVREAKALVAAGAIGPVRAVRIRTIIDKPDSYWRSGPTGRIVDDWRALRARSGGGVVLMNTIHQLDIVRFVTGLSFVRATADVATLMAPPDAGVEVEDSAAAGLRLSNGALVSLVAAAHSAGAQYEEEIEIDGSLGRIDLPDPYGTGSLRVFLKRAWPPLAADEWCDLPLARRNSHLELVRGFVDAVRHGSEPTADARDARAALATVLAIYQSAVTGRAVEVDMPIPGESRSS